MKQDRAKQIDNLTERGRRLRADLTATNLALTALMGALPQEQRQRWLASLAQLSAAQEQTAEQSGNTELIALLQPAVQRMYTALEGAHKMAR